MFLFIENLAALHIATHNEELRARRLVKFVSDTVLPYAEPGFSEHGLVVALPQKWIRLLKPVLSLTQLPVIQQDPFARAYRFNIWKQMISDGLLTEYLVRKLGIHARTFYSITSVSLSAVDSSGRCALVGSNWLEHGSMTEPNYRQHLAFLKSQYPDATYFCHPRERSSWPEKIFGSTQVERPKLPLEAHFRKNGLPAHLVGVCSTSMLALAVGSQGKMKVDVVVLEPSQYDGPVSDEIFTIRQRGQTAVRVCIQQLQDLLFDDLMRSGVPVRRVFDPVTSARVH